MKNLKRIITLVLALVISLSTLSMIAGCARKTEFTVTFDGGADDAFYYNAEGEKQPAGQDYEVIVKKGESVVPPIFARPNHNFVDWNATFDEIKEDMTITATWSQYKFSVTYEGMGGKTEDGEYSVTLTDIESGIQALERAPKFIKEGYSLSWDKSEQEFAAISENATVKAVWTANEYSITFKDKDGNDFANNVKKVAFDSNVGDLSIYAPIIDGKKFTHWTEIGNDGLPLDNGAEYRSVSDIVLKANYVDASTFVIYYDINGGNRENRIYSFDANCAEPPITNPKKTGYNFAGWKINGGDELKLNLTLDDLKIDGQFADIKLFAEWTPEPYYINFNTDGGTLSGESQIKIFYKHQIENLPSVTREGYQFAGWHYKGQKIIDGMEWEFAESATLEAKWLYTYKVKFSLQTTIKRAKGIIKTVECEITNLGSLEDKVVDGDILTFEKIFIEGETFNSAFKTNSFVLPTFEPKDKDEFNHKNGKWMFMIAETRAITHISSDTIFAPATFPTIASGGTIVIEPECGSNWAGPY